MAEPIAPVVGSWGTAPAVEADAPVPTWGTLAAASGAAASTWTPEPAASTADAPYDEDDDDDERPAHPYTWLQLLVLALVAFVLGFLIVMLANHSNESATPGAATERTPAQPVSTSHP